jgi:CRP/FNR family transcriptional regulator
VPKNPQKEPRQGGKSPKELPKGSLEILKLIKGLKGTPPLSALEDPVLKSLSLIARPRLCQRNELIFQQGDPARSVFLVVKGEVRVYISEPSGRERTLKIASPGDLFGEAAVFQEGGYPATSSAIKKALVLEFPKLSLIDLISEHPELAFATIGVMASRLKELTALIEGSLKDLEPRLASYLLTLPEKNGRVLLPMRKVELAKLLGTSPESLSRALFGLKSKKLINVEGATITLLDRAALEDHSL